MRKVSRVFLITTLVAALVGAFGVSAWAQINVTFRVNTATVPDTLKENHVVQIRGAVNGQTGAILPDGKTIDWGSSSELILQNVGGDYWEITFQMYPEDTLRYKFWAGFTTTEGVNYNTGWEANIVDADGLGGQDRSFISGQSDTVVALQFYNGTGQTQDQFWRPYALKPDSVAVFFRVNVAGVIESGRFNPDTEGPLGVRGNPGTSGGALDWGATRLITNESQNTDFWSGVIYFPKDSLTLGEQQKYKFFIENDDQGGWEDNIGDRIFVYSNNLVNVTMDTTLHWVYFNDQKPTGKTPVTSDLVFRVNVQALEGIGVFDRGVGDAVGVIGVNGWSVPDNLINLNFNALLSEWSATEPVTRIPGETIYYKYFLVWDSSRVNPQSPNFIPGLDNLSNGWEEPGLFGGSNRTLVFEGTAQQSPEGDYGQDIQFFNGVPPQGVITDPIEVTWNVDMRPATNAAINFDPLFDPAQDSVFIEFDGSLFALTQGLEYSGPGARIKLEDADGDTIYSVTLTLQTPTWYMNGFRITYFHQGVAYTNGGGVDPGRRYYRYVYPLSVDDQGNVTWPGQFTFALVEWKPGATLDYEDPPNLFQPVSIGDEPDVAVRKFDLFQNYPNPFNPSTTIRYQVARAAKVELQIYNVRGQLVKTLVNAKQNAGRYTLVWNGTNDAGVPVSSGIYFLTMKAGDFRKVQKMTLLK